MYVTSPGKVGSVRTFNEAPIIGSSPEQPGPSFCNLRMTVDFTSQGLHCFKGLSPKLNQKNRDWSLSVHLHKL